ncbi:GNAT family N-acetyltransferase [Paenarthrobacter sp. PH39-S1]|nr:GNAT family N-acetyltransferase [Paenarthrobacter sp. PH39-S1]
MTTPRVQIKLPPTVLDAGPVLLRRLGYEARQLTDALLNDALMTDSQLEQALSECADVVTWTYYPAHLTMEQAQARVVRAQESAAAGISARYVLERNGTAVGTAGLKNSDDAPEIFYALLPAGRGQGTATAAVNSLTAWALSAGAPYVALWTQIGNHASERVAERTGFRCADVRRADAGTAIPAEAGNFPGPRLWTRFPG